jgi:hypothetical protein
MTDPENENEDCLEIQISGPVIVRETLRLYRLTAGSQVAEIAADTEEEARAIAATQDARGGDWRNVEFASSQFEDTAELHVFGDAIFMSLAPAGNKSGFKGRK